ncbi:hypothetical protein L0337_40675 [candidate division KSB1 bacterium]|nr:hypothetical protein [candidate division KSB1 bacterium]
MIRTKQFLIVGKIAVAMAWLVPLAIGAGAKDKTPSAKDVRLVLSPQTRLQLPVAPLGSDSVEAKLVVAVPDSCKNQRYLCRLEAGAPVRLLTEPRYEWALQGDTLTVLSAVPLRIRLSRQSFASANPSPRLGLRVHYQNLDHPAKLKGTAIADLVAAETALPATPVKVDSAMAAAPSWDSAQAVQAQPPAVSAVRVDSMAAGTTASGGAFGVVYVVIAILLILFFGVLSWLMTWSQRRRFQKVEAKSATMPFSRSEHTQVSAPTAMDRAVATRRDAAHLKTAKPPEDSEPVLSPSPSDLPAVVPENGRDLSLASLLEQLRELNAGIRQVIVNQKEANRQLVEITSAAKLDVPPSSPQLSLFDILNDDAAARGGGRAKNGNAPSPQLRIQFAGDGNSDGVSVNLVASSPVNLELFTNDRRRDNLSVALQPSSKLRLLFANTEENGTGAGENPDHARLLDSGVSASKSALNEA